MRHSWRYDFQGHRGQGLGQEMTSVSYQDYFCHVSSYIIPCLDFIHGLMCFVIHFCHITVQRLMCNNMFVCSGQKVAVADLSIYKLDVPMPHVHCSRTIAKLLSDLDIPPFIVRICKLTVISAIFSGHIHLIFILYGLYNLLWRTLTQLIVHSISGMYVWRPLALAESSPAFKVLKIFI